MQEGIVDELKICGLTRKQAKVYLAILQAGSASIREIAESSKIFRQDVYKLLPKLEKAGLVARAIGRPVCFKAIPVKDAFEAFATHERNRADERISRIKSITKKLAELASEHQTDAEEFEAHFTLLSADAEIRNMTINAFENATKCDIVLGLELISEHMQVFREYFRKLRMKKVKVRLIIESLSNEDSVKEIIDNVKGSPDWRELAVKVIHKERANPYFVLDDKELFIARRKLTETGMPQLLWTNARSMVDFRKEKFEDDWNTHAKITIYPEMDRERIATGKKV